MSDRPPEPPKPALGDTRLRFGTVTQDETSLHLRLCLRTPSSIASSVGQPINNFGLNQLFRKVKGIEAKLRLFYMFNGKFFEICDDDDLEAAVQYLYTNWCSQAGIDTFIALNRSSLQHWPAKQRDHTRIEGQLLEVKLSEEDTLRKRRLEAAMLEREEAEQKRRTDEAKEEKEAAKAQQFEKNREAADRLLEEQEERSKERAQDAEDAERRAQ